MPRKKTIQPEPLETFELEDWTIVEIRDHETREKGPGKDKQWKARNKVDCILTSLLDMIQSSDNEQTEKVVKYAIRPR